MLAFRAMALGKVERFLIREVGPRDLDALYRLSKHLDSVNFPHDREVLAGRIRRARDSFGEKIEDLSRREYMFVLEGLETGRIAGTSMIFAQHGHSDSPHIFFDVVPDERFSITLDRHFSHITLRLGFNYRGPTEIGALVLDPSLRALGLGKQLSFVRFLFIAMFRPRFRPSVIAELMPPLLPDGRSDLWEHLGRHFTGLSYQEADKLSTTNKEFITSLFPQTPLYASLLPAHVRRLIGEVGDETKGVRRMLESIGFEYSDRIDPFDGGPHFEARTDDITLVKAARRAVIAPGDVSDEEETKETRTLSRVLIAAAQTGGASRFRATAASVDFDGDQVHVSKTVRALLRVKTGADVWAIPLR